MSRSIFYPALIAVSLVASPVVAAVPHAQAEVSALDQSASYDRKRGSRDSHHHSSSHREVRHGDYRHYDSHDHRHYQRCRRDDGTAGLLIGGAVGAAVGNEVAEPGDKTTGALLGAAGGALIGKNLDDGVKCR